MSFDNVFKSLPTLETERTILRKLSMDDAEAIYSYASKDDVSQNVTWDTHQSLEETKMFIEFALERYNNEMVAPWGIVHKETGRIIGTVDFVWWRPEHRTAEVGYVLSPDFWGQGIMPEVVHAIISFGFEKMGLVRIQAQCFEQNSASERVMQKVGMTFEGTMRKKMYVKGKHQDVKMYAIVK